jgi:hypothetical protein
MRDTYVEGITCVRRDGSAFGCMYESLRGYAFGPSFDSRGQADNFIEWLWQQYSVEPDTIDALYLRRYYDEWANRIAYIQQDTVALGHAVIVWRDTPCNAQVAVVREHWGSLEGNIEPTDMLGIEYICRAHTPSEWAAPSPTSEEGETIWLVPASHCKPVVAWGILLSLRNGGLECTPMLDPLDGLPAWEICNPPWDARLLVPNWQAKVVEVERQKPIYLSADAQALWVETLGKWCVGLTTQITQEKVNEVILDTPNARLLANENSVEVADENAAKDSGPTLSNSGEAVTENGDSLTNPPTPSIGGGNSFSEGAGGLDDDAPF